MYNFYEVVTAINDLQSYIQEYIFPLVLLLLFINCLFVTISLLRWFYK